jgi:hypothetical protein
MAPPRARSSIGERNRSPAGPVFRVGHMSRAADPAITDAYLKATAEYIELTS